VIAGKYRVERVLGVGGMGVVVKALHTQLDERVAIKFLLPEGAADKAIVARFSREARAAVKIKSEHVARVIDVGELEGGAPFMVMEHLEGSDLAQVLDKRGRLLVPDAVDFLLQACEAIAEAHALGIVHRDLKPANLFLTRRADGSHVIKVLDFGISKMAKGGEGATTDTSAILGSPLYMSPEQLRASKAVDARTDIWSLGVLLHELLVNDPPFGGDSLPVIVTAILEQPPRSLRAARPEVPEALEAVVARCLEKLPSSRFADVADLARALVPFAPAQRGAASAERIARVISGSGHASSLLASTRPPASSAVEAVTLAADVGPRADVLSPGEGAEGPDPATRGPGRLTDGAISRDRTPKRRVASLGAGVAIAAVAGAALAFAMRAGGQGAPAQPADPSANVAPAALADTASPLATPTASTSVSAPVVAVVPAEPGSASSESPKSAPSKPASPRPAASAAKPAVPPKAAAKNCSPPFTIDADGAKHAKLECL
jgi:serine/threonine-protein kinase